MRLKVSFLWFIWRRVKPYKIQKLSIIVLRNLVLNVHFDSVSDDCEWVDRRPYKPDPCNLCSSFNNNNDDDGKNTFKNLVIEDSVCCANRRNIIKFEIQFSQTFVTDSLPATLFCGYGPQYLLPKSTYEQRPPIDNDLKFRVPRAVSEQWLDCTFTFWIKTCE
jgi:hypothetical protein